MLTSILERVLQRSSGAVVTLLLAGFVGPATLGAYSFTMLALVLAQVSLETTFRQAVSLAGPSPRSRRQLRLGSGLMVLVGTPLVLGAALAAADRSNERGVLVDLLPLVLVPAVNALALRSLVVAQWSGDWGAIGRSQLAASIGSLVVAVPLLAWRPLMAAGAQSLVAESIFTIGILVVARRARADLQVDTDVARRAPLRETLTSNLVAWGQGQGDRVAVSALSTASIFGAYTLALSVTRALADAAAVGINNFLRAALGRTSSRQTSAMIGVAIRRAAQYALVAQVATLAGVWVVLRPALGQEWDGALSAVALLGMAVVPSMIAACTTVALLHYERGRTLILIQGAGLVLGLGVGLAASQSLVLAAWVLFAREVLLMAVRLVTLRANLQRRTVAATAVFTAGGAVLGLLGYMAWVAT